MRIGIARLLACTAMAGTLASGPALAQASTPAAGYWFRIGGAAPVGTTTPPTTGGGEAPTDGGTTTPPPQESVRRPTWGFCGTSTALTPGTADCDADGTPNMRPDVDGTLVDADPDDGWEPTWDEEDVADHDATAPLSFAPIHGAVPGTYAYSAPTRYNGRDLPWIGVFDEGFLLQVCKTPAECQAESPQWTEYVVASDATGGPMFRNVTNGEYVRLRYDVPATAGAAAVTATIYVDEPADDTGPAKSTETSWKVTPKATSGGSGGSGGGGGGGGGETGGETDPVDLPSMSYWRVRFDRFCAREPGDEGCYAPNEDISEIGICFVDGRCTSDGSIPAVSSPSGGAGIVTNGNYGDRWEPGGGGGSVAFTLQGGSYPKSYVVARQSPRVSESPPFVYMGDFLIEGSPDGQAWTTFDTRRDIQSTYGARLEFQVAPPPPEPR